MSFKLRPPTQTEDDGVMTVEEFLNAIKTQRNVIIKFSAVWCGPCKKAHSYIDEKWKNHIVNSQIIFREVDVDKSMDLFMFLKSKKIVTAMPTFLFYHASNCEIHPSNVLVGFDKYQLDLFLENALTT